MKIAYLDCFSGVSEDMLVGSFLDAGLPFETLKGGISGLKLNGYRIAAKKEKRNNIIGTRFTILLEQGHQDVRLLEEIEETLQGSDLPSPIIEQCTLIFQKLAMTEGEIRNVSPHEVPFREPHAVTVLIGMVAALLGTHLLGIEKFFVSRIPVAHGTVTGAHGKIPVPTPATTALLKGVPIYDDGQDVELVTPAGAALITSLSSSFGRMPPMIIDSIGYGVGGGTLPDRPNLVRILIGDDTDKQNLETVVLLESNLDDMSPELLGYLMDQLFDAGALDVSFCPVQMKKNRPGIQLQVVGRPEDNDRLITIIFRESTTLGIRTSYSQRAVLRRHEVVIDSPWGKMRVKKIINRDGASVLLPEYEECRRIAREKGLALREIYAWAAALSRRP